MKSVCFGGTYIISFLQGKSKNTWSVQQKAGKMEKEEQRRENPKHSEKYGSDKISYIQAKQSNKKKVNLLAW